MTLVTAVVAAFAAASHGGAAGVARTVDRDPVFSPGGRTIAFVRWTGGIGRVMLVRRDGHGLRAVGPAEALPYGLSWSPDGRSLAYVVEGDIWRLDLATGHHERLTSGPETERQPDWSPDGTTIVFGRFFGCFRCTQLGFVAAAGGEPPRYVGTPSSARRPRWSPDGRLIALSQSAALVVDTSGSTVVPEVPGGAYPAWSPDGTRIASTGSGLHVTTLATGETRLVSTAIDAYPTWSRDGSAIAGASWSGRHVVLVRPSGRVLARIPASASNDSPTWGADGRVAFVHPGMCGIDVAHADGTRVRRLTRVC